jgi:hypothetical protein
MMDPVTFYRLGQIRHQEIVKQAEQQRFAASLRAKPALWERVRAHLSAGQIASPASEACPPLTRREVIALNQ